MYPSGSGRADSAIMKRDDNEDPSPPSPFSYFFPLLFVILACGGYIYYRRSSKRAASGGIPLHFPPRAQSGIRLSEDGPPTHSFTHDNASTDSLPTHGLEEIPELGSRPTSTSASNSAFMPSREPSPLPGTLPSAGLSKPTATGKIPGMAAGRRSMKARGPRAVESDSESDQGHGGQQPFGLGDGESDSGSGSDDPGSDLGPLGRR